jgi:hypothetical protein
MIATTNPMTLRDFFADVYRPLRLIDAGRGTIQQYEIAINRLSHFLGRDATLDDLTEFTDGEADRAGEPRKEGAHVA